MDATRTTYSPSSVNQKQQSIFKDVDWVHPDGRGFHQYRPSFLKTCAVNSTSGSASAKFGNTKVIVSLFGPRESKKAMMCRDTGRLNCNVSYTNFSSTIRGQGADNKEFSSMLHKALEGAIILESFPKTTVDVFALVLESGGSSTVPHEVDADKEVVFTYDVSFQASGIKWASHWDTYLLMNDDQIHWFLIINSLMIAFFLSGMVAMIMTRTLYRDITNYNQLETQDEGNGRRHMLFVNYINLFSSSY